MLHYVFQREPLVINTISTASKLGKKVVEYFYSIHMVFSLVISILKVHIHNQIPAIYILVDG